MPDNRNNRVWLKVRLFRQDEINICRFLIQTAPGRPPIASLENKSREETFGEALENQMSKARTLHP
jgi:uncharacterized membrane protein